MPKNPLIVDTKFENIYIFEKPSIIMTLYHYFCYIYCSFFWSLYYMNTNKQNDEIITVSKYIEFLLINPIIILQIFIKACLLSIIFSSITLLFFPKFVVSYIVPLIALLSGEACRQLYC
jgi:hypothetical protein